MRGREARQPCVSLRGLMTSINPAACRRPKARRMLPEPGLMFHHRANCSSTSRCKASPVPTISTSRGPGSSSCSPSATRAPTPARRRRPPPVWAARAWPATSARAAFPAGKRQGLPLVPTDKVGSSFSAMAPTMCSQHQCQPGPHRARAAGRLARAGGSGYNSTHYDQAPVRFFAVIVVL